MRCPRCDSLVDTDAVRCCECGAPLQLRDEPAPARLDVDLDLDRRRRRAGSTATRAPSGRAAAAAARSGGALGQHDLGDLSFDPPSDDAPWTLGARPDDAGSIDEDSLDDAAGPDEDGPLDDQASKQSAGAADSAAWEETATVYTHTVEGGDEGDEDARVALAPPREEPARAAAALGVQSHVDDDLDDDADEESELEAEPADAIDDHPAVHRGRILSYASIGVAAAVALVAFLTR